MTNELSMYLDQSGFSSHREYLLSIARPSIEIVNAESSIARGCSKFGGRPDLPKGFGWPTHSGGPYRFLGQFNLADIPEGEFGFPGTGLISFFFGYDEEGETHWDASEYIRVYPFDNLVSLRSVAPPESVDLGETVAIQFQLSADVPAWPISDDLRKTWPLNENHFDAYWDLRCKLHFSLGYLLGYPFNPTLAYDPSPGPEWRSLLTLRSDENLEWSWHDGARLVTFIEENRLHAGDFSQIKYDAG